MSDSVPRVIYQFWTGDNPITSNRLNGLRTNSNIKVETRLLYPDDIKKCELPDHPFHPAFKYLHNVHKSDYLRCYFCHHFGGGYMDIKSYSPYNNWAESFDYINKHPETDVVGEAETIGGSPIGYNGESENYNDREHCQYLVRNGFIIVRQYSKFSSIWYDMLNKKLDEKLHMLEKCNYIPVFNKNNNDFDYSRYQIRWAELMGEIFHRICYSFRGTDTVKRTLISGWTYIPYR